ncbi:MAG: 2-isopropylmalate synthase [Clostridiales bacterium]|nr:2-isopropylmalate synthase [Candidatus Crickella merdequi]
MINDIKIFDTTLRDGEQAPGCSMNLKEKIEVAKCLERLKVDIIEAGFAISSPGDFESVKTVAETVKDCTVASLSRSVQKDIDAAYNAVKGAVDPRIHVFLATSPLHMEYKLKMTEDQVIENAAAAVKYARSLCSNIEFSCEDATRSDYDFMVKVVNAVVANGATTINLPDTVGYTTPDEMRNLISYVQSHIDNPEDVIFSVHCHNDLGMATANSLGGVLGGARQIECTINGLGERAGNTSLEEVVMAMRTRPDIFASQPRIDTTQISKASKTVYNIIGQSAPLNKPIVGKNAFAHEAGIHQHGVLANKATYEIMTPESVGITANNLVLGKHSGKHAFETRLKELGYELSKEELLACFEEFKVICDKKKTVNDSDLEAIVNHSVIKDEEGGYKLNWFSVNTSNFTTATCTINLEKNGKNYEAVCLGDGPLDAAFGAINKIAKPGEHTFADFSIFSISEGKDTIGDATIKLTNENKTYTGHGLSTDVIESSIVAYIQSVNKLIKQREEAAN